MYRAGFAVLAGLTVLCAAEAEAQIPVLQSAETVRAGTFKAILAPTPSFGKNGADDQIGVALRAGYGLTDRLDLEAKTAFFENETMLGADLELWAIRARPANFSIAAGGHYMWASGDHLDVGSIDLIPQASFHFSDGFELCTAVPVGFASVRDAPEGIDDSFTRVHLVPGVEFRLSDEADLEAEFGIGMNDDSFHYLGLGIAFYLR